MRLLAFYDGYVTDILHSTSGFFAYCLDFSWITWYNQGKDKTSYSRLLLVSHAATFQIERKMIMELNELDSTCGLSDEELTERFKASIRIDNEIRRIKGLPTAKYDAEKKRAYLEYPDGRIEYVGNNEA